MFRLDKVHRRLFSRLTTGYPRLFGPYSHRIEKSDGKLTELSIAYDGEPLVSAATARELLRKHKPLPGEVGKQAEELLDNSPEGRFAVIHTGPGDWYTPFLYLEEAASGGVQKRTPLPSARSRTPIPSGITAADVLEAIRAFSAGSVEHGFHDSEKYDLVHEGGRYPPKAILGISARRILGRVLQPKDFSGGEDSACFARLRALGFTVELKPNLEAAEGADWSDAEIDAAVSAYLSMLRAEIEGKEFSKAEVNRQLRTTSLTTRTKGSVEYRMQNISSVLKALNRRWIVGYKPAANVGTEVTRKIVASLERLEAVSREDAVPDADPIAFERKVRRNRLVPPAQPPEGASAPKKVTRTVEQYERDPRVKAWVLQNAKGKCQLCGNDAPFVDEVGLAFLEVHHIIPLAEKGKDNVKNAVALCPNCHRRCHHGADRAKIAVTLTQTASTENI